MGARRLRIKILLRAEGVLNVLEKWVLRKIFGL
jgi:hypothetical protein